MFAAAGGRTTWSPQISEAAPSIRSRATIWQIECPRRLRRKSSLQATNPGGRHGYECSTDFPSVRSHFRPLLRDDRGFLVPGTHARRERPSPLKRGGPAADRTWLRRPECSFSKTKAAERSAAFLMPLLVVLSSGRCRFRRLRRERGIRCRLALRSRGARYSARGAHIRMTRARGR